MENDLRALYARYGLEEGYTIFRLAEEEARSAFLLGSSPLLWQAYLLASQAFDHFLAEAALIVARGKNAF